MVDSHLGKDNESCWKWKLRSRFQWTTRRLSHETQGDSSGEPVLDNPPSNLEQDNFSRVRTSEKSLARPRSVPDISETLRTGHRDVVIVQERLTPIENHQIQNVQQNHLQSSSGSGSGGILSFFGVRFHKSGTRHLDRSGGDRVPNSDSSLDKPGKTVDRDHRYTKFPLTSPSQISQQSGGGIANNICTIPLHTDSPFDVTHIHLTPQTKTYIPHPHKSPLPPVKGNPNKFLAHAVSLSLGRKSNNVNTDSSSHNRSHHKRNKQLKIKSKSDNSLHKVTLNNVNVIGGNHNHHHTNSVLSPDSYPQGEQRLNSVQLGDHATIRLPWTGFQPQHLNNLNNLSSSTANRTHPNTHNNHLLDLDSVRYVECGVWSGTTSSSNNTNNQAVHHSRNTGRHPSRRRSRSGGSLERKSNFRVFPINYPSTISQGNHRNQHSSSNNKPNNSHAKSFSRDSNSLERPSRHRVRQSLSPSEQEILFRNLASCNNQHLFQVPPPLPKKAKPPPLGRLHRSAPNSSFSSVESSSSDSASACSGPEHPPSPPPRPPSTLRPIESRPAITTSSSSSNTRPNSTLESPNNTTTPSLINNNQNNINDNNNITSNKSQNIKPTMNRRPVIPRSSDQQSTIVLSSSDTQDLGNECLNSINVSGNSASGMSLEEARNSGFINKPSKGWIHSDNLLSKQGVTYTVRYIGCLDVNTSMKSLDFDTRSLIAKECINQVCEAAGLKSVDKKRKTDRRVARILGLHPRLDQAGSDVHLTITSTCLKLTSLDTGNVIATHDLPNISFASGGDATMLDFVAYVAKDSVVGRACFVLECGSGRAQDVITTVGQAFELRFKEYLQKRPSPPPRNDDPDREYYNDLPGKEPPEVTSSTTHGVSDSKESNSKGGGSKGTPTHLTLPTSFDNKDVISVNLIDFECPTPPAFTGTQDRNLEALLLSGGGTVSPTSPSGSHGNGLSSGLISPGPPPKDPFNMQPFAISLPTPSSSQPLSPGEQKMQLESEPWFHGVISRAEAEALVRNDGDFLVRESQTTPGQYVLTGLRQQVHHHLLLVDPEGVVRTKDHSFESVIHLIRYHSDNSLPIISADRKAVGSTGSMVCLTNPILRYGVPGKERRKEI